MDVPWTVDNGSKWLLATAGEGGLRTSLPYAGRSIDPELRFVPIGRPFARVIEDRLVSQYPVAFSLLSRPFLRLFGSWGGYVLPLLGALLAAWGAGRLAERWAGSSEDGPVRSPVDRPTGPSADRREGSVADRPTGSSADPREGSATDRAGSSWTRSALVWGFLFAGPLGPLAWYGTTFWEHTLVAASVVWAVLFWSRGKGDGSAVAAGLLLASGTWMREETVLIVLALLAAVFVSRDGRRCLRRGVTLVATYSLALLPFLFWQRWITGSFFGFHFSGNVEGSLVSVLTSDRLSVIRGLLWSGDEGATEAGDLALTLLAALLAVFVAHSSSRRVRTLGVAAVSAMVGTIALVCILALRRETDMPMTLIRTAGLFFFAPWIVWCCALRRAATPRAAWSGPVSVVLFLLVTPAVTAFGFHWGPRVLLSTVPLLAAVAALGIGRLQARVSGPLPLFGAVFLVFACLTLQAYGGSIQAQVTRGAGSYLERTRVEVEGTDDVPLVTHQWWYASTFAPLLLERPVHKVRSKIELRGWVDAFGKAGGERFFWATAAPDDEILAGLPLRIVGTSAMDGYPRAYRHRLVELVLEKERDR